MLHLAHKQLEVYKSAIKIVKTVYSLTAKFPVEEKFLLVNQIRRAAVSVCSNIAEGAARISKTERKRFYEISRSSVVELDTQIQICVMLGYLDIRLAETLTPDMEAVFKMLSKMILTLSKDNA